MSSVELIRERLIEAFRPSFLEVVNESNAHKAHAAYQKGGRHFSICISSPCFNDCSRLEAHRKIYALFTDLMPYPIHALKIKILSSEATV